MAAGKLKLDLQKRQHRERSQPAHRQKLGLLEKHKDYVKRARDFHSKEDRIQKLREKAAGRNKDEFYFGMIKARTKKGVHIQSRGNEPLPQDLVTVLKSQDAGYIRSQVAMEQGRVERLQVQLDALVDAALPGAASSSKAAVGDRDAEMYDEDDWDMYDDDEPSTSAPKRNHVVFTDSIDAVRSGNTSALLRKRSTPSALPSASSSSPATQQTAKQRRKGKGKAVLEEEEAIRAERQEVEDKVREEAKTHRAALTEELTARQSRLLQLRRAARELDLQRQLMGKGAKSSIIKQKGDAKAKEEEWWNKGGKPGRGERREAEEAGGLPMAEEGVTTGARVWKWKAQRKR
ncbi:hypothetical protein JCM10207_004440 [Rhodosporidiobolus poonsookiae]